MPFPTAASSVAARIVVVSAVAGLLVACGSGAPAVTGGPSSASTDASQFAAQTTVAPCQARRPWGGTRLDRLPGGLRRTRPAWWLNLQAQPDTTVDLADGSRPVRARVAVGEERERLWANLRDYRGWGDDLDAPRGASVNRDSSGGARAPHVRAFCGLDGLAETVATPLMTVSGRLDPMPTTAAHSPAVEEHG